MAADDVDYAGQKQKKGCGAKVRSCCNSIWNHQKKEFLGRTASSWAKISLFYIVFYSCLAGFFAIMLVGFFSTVDDRVPTMTNMYSLIKQNPGMGFRPMTHHESTLIWFNSSDPDTYYDKVDNIIAFLKEQKYINDDLSPNTNVTKDGDGKDVFDFNSMSADCSINKTSKNDSFGFSSGKPCILLKINRVINWMPKKFENSTELDPELEKDARKNFNGTLPTGPNIAVSCEGENDGDIDNLGKVNFFPKEGFSFNFYPYTNAEDYRPPLVFAQINPKKGVIMQVWCKLWVSNIKHHKNDKGGSVHFELLVDAPLSK